MTAEKENTFLVFRRNELYEQHINNVARGIENTGRNVQVKGFERENFDENLKNWMQDNYSELEKGIIIGDNTSRRLISRENRNKGLDRDKYFAENNSNSSSYLVTLDNIFFRAISRIVLPEEVNENLEEPDPKRFKRTLIGKIPKGITSETEEADKIYEVGRRTYESIIGEMINSENPNNAYVCLEKILSHEPLDTARNSDPRLEDSYEEQIQFAKDYFSEILANAGINNYQFLENSNEIKNYDTEGNWIFADRHATKPAGGYDIITENARLMEIPFENLYSSAIKYNLLNPRGLEVELERVSYEEAKNV